MTGICWLARSKHGKRMLMRRSRQADALKEDHRNCLQYMAGSSIGLLTLLSLVHTSEGATLLTTWLSWGHSCGLKTWCTA